MIKEVLLTYDMIPELLEAFSNATELIGLDIETEDSQRHEGLNKYMSIDDEGFNNGKKLVFDVNRTTLCGLSLYPKGHDKVYYINVNHADVGTRISQETVLKILNSLPEDKKWCIHNAPFEMVFLKQTIGYDVPEDRFVDTMYLSVYLFGPDEYDPQKLQDVDLDSYISLLQESVGAFAHYQHGEQFTFQQASLFNQIVGKTNFSKASYNALTRGMSWGYGLKQAVKSWFGHEMTTFKQVLGDKPHMGCLTSSEVMSYGCDDAYWAVMLFDKLVSWGLKNNPKAIVAYFKQEIPIIPWYAETHRLGICMDRERIDEMLEKERENYAVALREFQNEVRKLLPFKPDPNKELLEYDPKWYPKNWAKKRKEIEDWANLELSDDELLLASSSPIAKQLNNGKKIKAVNLTYYMTVRTLIYDLGGVQVIRSKGKVQSDSDTRGKILESLDPKTPLARVLQLIGLMSQIEKRVGSYIVAYTYLTDPDTGRIYPVTSSLLATRRMSMENPTGQNMPKRGAGTYTRGFVLGDQLYG